MPALLALLLVLAILLLFWITANILGVLFTLLIAGLIGWLADSIVPGRLPYGWVGAVLAGLVGSWIGTWLMGHFGPSIAGIAIIPAIVGAVIVALAVRLLHGAAAAERRR